MKREFKVTPYEVSGAVDYNRIVKEFGVEIISQDIVGNILVDSPPWTFDQMNQPPSKPSIE